TISRCCFRARTRRRSIAVSATRCTMKCAPPRPTHGGRHSRARSARTGRPSRSSPRRTDVATQASVAPSSLPPAAAAFDAIAEGFDGRYGAWLSVAAQRRAVRSALTSVFPVGARLLDVGGGTGEDAEYLIRAGRDVLLTDVSPAMVRVAGAKLQPLGAQPP